MAVNAITAVLTITCILNSVQSRKLPSFIQTCDKNSLDLNQCMRDATEQARPRLSNGIPEMHVPPLDPLHIPHVELDMGATFKATFDKIRIYGLSNFVLKNLNFNINENKIDVHLLFPYVTAIADYSMKGRILIMQLNGLGKCEGNYTNLETQAVISGKRLMRKGKEHVDFDKISLELHFGNQNTLVFENIFRGNKELTDQTNKIISENIEGIMMEIKPVFDETVAQLVLSLLKGVFDRYSIDDLFPNNE